MERIASSKRLRTCGCSQGRHGQARDTCMRGRVSERVQQELGYSSRTQVSRCAPPTRTHACPGPHRYFFLLFSGEKSLEDNHALPQAGIAAAAAVISYRSSDTAARCRGLSRKRCYFDTSQVSAAGGGAAAAAVTVSSSLARRGLLSHGGANTV